MMLLQFCCPASLAQRPAWSPVLRRRAWRSNRDRRLGRTPDPRRGKTDPLPAHDDDKL